MAFTERSRASREAILTAARRRFSEQGYARTTIRLIAFDAKVDPSMVIRYYGSKDRLFAAAVDTDLHLPDLSGCDPEQQANVLARHFLALWNNDEGGSLTLLLRSAVTQEAAANRLRTAFTDQVAPMMRATYGATATSDVRTALASMQLFGIALARYVLRLPPIVDLDDDDLIAFAAWTLHRILVDPIPMDVSTEGSAHDRSQ
jgi:AcrR family transcriptional regulator